MVLSPIILKGEYKFLTSNLLMIFMAVLYFRMVFAFKDLPYMKSLWIRVPIFLLNFHFIIMIFTAQQDVIPRWESQNIFQFMYDLKVEQNLAQRRWLVDYIRNEYLLSGVAGVVSIIALNTRILASFFTRNTRRFKEMLQDTN
jgi:hypothetical protein